MQTTPPYPCDPHEAAILQDLRESEPLAVVQRRLAESDALIRLPDLDNGRDLVAARAAVFSAIAGAWVRQQQAALGYERPFALVAIGGSGRAEMTPCSDLDFALLFEEPVEGNAFLKELMRQTLHTGEFRERHGFHFGAQAYHLDHAEELEGKQLNAFLDMAPVHDPCGLAAAFRERLRAGHDPFAHFLHVRELWTGQWQRAGEMAERIDRFDIKNEGLRLFQAGVWTLASADFLHSHEVYRDRVDPADLAAYHFLLRIRCWIQDRQPVRSVPSATGDHPEDLMRFDDFLAFGDMLDPAAGDRERFEFADEVRARLLNARRRIASFARGVIEGELHAGRRIAPGSPVALGAAGLSHEASEEDATPARRSGAALRLLRAAQIYGLPIDPAEVSRTFRNAGQWLEPVPELGRLFAEPRGSLAASFDFLSQIAGAEERLFPGYAKFESSVDQRVLAERRTLRGPLERAKLRALESDRSKGQRLVAEGRPAHALTDEDYAISIPVEAALVPEPHLAAIRLALKTKRLPVTDDDLAARSDPARPLHERFSSGFSGIPLEDYYERCFAGAGFPAGTLEVARFLVANRKLLQQTADADLMAPGLVAGLVDRCDGDLTLLRTLFVFSCADRAEWESETHDPARWFNIRELYGKARMSGGRRFDPLGALRRFGYDREQTDILRDFGEDFFEGIYRHYALRLGQPLLKLRDGLAGPQVLPIQAGASLILGVAARDDLGTAASISGALWKHGVALRQAHLFSAMNHGLALDFFHLAPANGMTGAAEEEEGGETPGAAAYSLCQVVEQAITGRLHIGEEDEAALPDVARNLTLGESRADLLRLEAETFGEDVGALVYVLACKAFRRLGANIHGLAAHTGRDRSRVSVYLSLPETLSLDEARRIVAEWG